MLRQKVKVSVPQHCFFVDAVFLSLTRFLNSNLFQCHFYILLKSRVKLQPPPPSPTPPPTPLHSLTFTVNSCHRTLFESWSVQLQYHSGQEDVWYVHLLRAYYV
jgi:hypothetical protein